jgi:hypothetical protein
MLKMAVIGLVALTLSIRVAAAGDAQAVSDDFSVTLGRTTCFGECPEYSVTIDAQGLVRYEGRKFVRVEGIQTDRLPVARVAALFAQIERIRFFDFNESYRTIHTPDGEISVTDLPTTMVSVTYGGRSKQILDYLGAPAPLKQLEKEIDAVARTKRWVTLDDETLQQMIRDGWLPSAAERSELLRKALQGTAR